MRAPRRELLSETYPAQKILEPGVAAQRVVSRVYVKRGQTIGMLSVCLFQPGDTLVVVPDTDVCRNNNHRIHGLSPVQIQQFPQCVLCFPLSTGATIGVGQCRPPPVSFARVLLFDVR
jgi:hypothetical protein